MVKARNRENEAQYRAWYGTDLRLVFPGENGSASQAQIGAPDLALNGADLDTVSGLDNLLQALKLRILTEQGELAQLGHSRYGSKIADLIGEPLDRANLELLRRYVRKELLQERRVADVVRVAVALRPDDPGAIDIAVTVVAVSGETLSFEVSFDA